jgi:hypothetical protein
MPYEPSPDLRASDADREAVVERLQIATHEGRLEPAELDERLTAVYNARWSSQLAALTADVTPPPPAPVGPPTFIRSPPTNALAVVSFICGLLWMGWAGSALAVVFGHVALRQVRDAQGREGGRGLAIAGLALGYAGLLVFLLFALFVFGV